MSHSPRQPLQRRLQAVRDHLGRGRHVLVDDRLQIRGQHAACVGWQPRAGRLVDPRAHQMQQHRDFPGQHRADRGVRVEGRPLDAPRRNLAPARCAYTAPATAANSRRTARARPGRAACCRGDRPASDAPRSRRRSPPCTASRRPRSCAPASNAAAPAAPCRARGSGRVAGRPPASPREPRRAPAPGSSPRPRRRRAAGRPPPPAERPPPHGGPGTSPHVGVRAGPAGPRSRG